MRIRRNELLTGLLVLVTFGILISVVVVLGAPGLFGSLNKYSIFFDNAGGIKPGTSVLLAGRKVGQVIELQSPVPVDKRPPEHPNCEVLIRIQVQKEAKIYQKVNVRMNQYGMLGQKVIDFTKGDERSGLAQSGTTFIGEREPGLSEVAPAVLNTIHPVAEEATAALQEMTKTLMNLNGLTSDGGELREAAANARDFTDTIKREPWRLLWRSTKQYPKSEHEDTEELDSAGKEKNNPSSTPNRSKVGGSSD